MTLLRCGNLDERGVVTIKGYDRLREKGMEETTKEWVSVWLTPIL
ncbi:MAG: hypothetical protein AAF348_00220 [Bacteroidota bacterium]